MKATIHHFLYPVLAISLLVGGVSFWRASSAYHDAIGYQRGKDEQIKAYQQQAGKAAQHSEQVGKQEKKDVQRIQQQAQKPLTSEQVKELVKGLLPKADVQTVQSPQGPLIAVQDTPEIREEIQQQKAQCDICKVSLTSRNLQYQDAITQIDAKQQEIAALRLERDKWKVAAGHHGFWGNLREWGIRTLFAGGGYAVGKMTK